MFVTFAELLLMLLKTIVTVLNQVEYAKIQNTKKQYKTHPTYI